MVPATALQRLTFREILLSDVSWMRPMMQKAGNRACEYAFLTTYMWRNFYYTRIAQAEDCLLMRSEEDGESCYMVLGGDLMRGLDLLEAHCRSEQEPFRVFCTGEEDAQIIATRYAGRFEKSCNEGDTDYIYRTSDLAQLPGSRYHAKRNHIAAFSKKYDWRYAPLTEDNLDDARQVSRLWYETRIQDADDEIIRELSNEHTAVEEVLKDWKQLDLSGGLIYVDEKAVAFTLASAVTEDTVDVHVEKALPEYAGAYAVINREFAAHQPPSCLYLNREDDMGLEGLRRAKHSYHPIELLKKYTFEITRV